MTKAEELRKKFVGMIAADGMITAPGCYDALTATLISSAGFDCAYMTGAGTSIAKGFPDFGLMTMTEMVANAEVIANASSCPVICDADTGYGNELNMTRTVHEYERAGVTGIHIEDQGFPKKCGHLDDKEIIPLDDYVAKIRAAVAARRDPNFQIIARTDARAVLGFEEAVRRGNASLEAGADMVRAELAALAAEWTLDGEDLTATGEWRELHLLRSGEPHPGCDLLPATCALGRQMQALRAPAAADAGLLRMVGDVKLSRMSPGTEVKPHCGPTNARLRAHLGLYVPEGDCCLRCGDEARRWVEGEVLLFDDSFEHEVWNETAEPRLVLIVDLWHPQLRTDSQRRGAMWQAWQADRYSQVLAGDFETTTERGH